MILTLIKPQRVSGPFLNDSSFNFSFFLENRSLSYAYIYISRYSDVSGPRTDSLLVYLRLLSRDIYDINPAWLSMKFEICHLRT